MDSSLFTSQELFDVLIRETRAEPRDHVYVIRIAHRLLQSEKGLVQLIGTTDIALHEHKNPFSKEQKDLLQVLGITFVEKESCFLMFSVRHLTAYYEREDAHNFIWVSGVEKSSLERKRTIKRTCLNLDDSIPTLLHKISQVSDAK